MNVHKWIGMQVGGPPCSYRQINSDQIIEQKFKRCSRPIKPHARHVDLALMETGRPLGLTSIINSTASSVSKSHKEYFEKPELRRINVMSKKQTPARMYESRKTNYCDHIKDDEWRSTNKLQQSTDVT
jgi:hypothetical protein